MMVLKHFRHLPQMFQAIVGASVSLLATRSPFGTPAIFDMQYLLIWLGIGWNDQKFG
jgi:hypothetical protein